MAQGKINFTVGFQVDQSGLNQLKQSLASLQTMQAVEFKANSFDEAKTKLKNIKTVASEVQNALAQSFNAKLNTYNIDVFQKKLAESGMTLGTLQTQFAEAGVKGQIAFRNLATSITSTKLPLQESHNLLRSMGKTFANTIKWSIASTAINTVTSSIQQAWSYTQKLDESLNNIMLVTEKSADQMSNFAVQANKAAKALGATTTDYTNAALIYYQQGLSDAEVKARTETTLKTANVTKQSTDAVSEQLTAVWNGYKVSAAESELYIDKLASVAASTAADLEELSTGMSKVASAANNMGVDIDQLNGLLATAISVTRQAPETVGTAFKTIFARITDIEAGLEEDTTLGEYTEQMAKLGISVLDSNNKLRNMGDVIEEIGAKWQSLSREQQVALAQTMAGTRQYNNLLAVFENWGMYEQAVKTSANSVGFLQQQNEEYLTSIEAHLTQLKTSGERVYKALLDPKDANNLIDVLTEIVDLFANFVESIGGGKNLLMALIPLMTRAFSGTIASGLATFVTNLGNASTKAQMLRNMLSTIDNIKSAGLDEYTSKIVELKNQLTVLAQQGVITNEEFNTLSDSLQEYSTWANHIDMAQNTVNKTPDQYKQILASTGMKSSLDDSVWTDLVQHGKSTFEGSTDALSFFTDSDAGQKLTAELDIAKTKVQEIFTATSQIEGSVKQISKIKTADKDLTEKQNKTVDTLKNKYEELKKTLLQVADNNPTDPASEKIQRQIANIDKLIIKNDNTRTGVKQLANEINKLAVQGEQAGQKLNTQIDGVQSNLYEIVSGTLPRLQAKAGELNQTFEAFLPRKTLEAKIQGFTNLASQAAMAASAISMIANIGDIFSNKDLSTGEKILQLVQNLGFAIPMLIPSILMIGQLISTNNLKLIKRAEIKKIELDFEKAITKEQTKQAFWDTVFNELGEDAVNNIAERLAGEKDITEEKIRQAYFEELANKRSQGRGFNAKKQSFKEGMNAAKAQKGSSLKSKFNFKANKAAGVEATAGSINAGSGSAGATFGALIPYLTVAAAIIASIATTIALISRFNNKAKKEWEDAKKDAERAKQAAQEAQQSYDNLTSSIDKLGQAEDNLKNLTKGTVEWNKALQDVNSQVLELLNTYPELSKYVYRDAETGALAISSAGQELVQQKALDRINKSNSAMLVSNMRADRTETVYLQQQWLNAENNDTAQDTATGIVAAGGGAAAGISSGLAIGAGAGTWAGPIGIVVGAAVGAAVAGISAGVSEAIQDTEDERAKEEFLQSDKYDEFMQKYLLHGEEVLKSEDALREALDLNLEEPLDNVYSALLENSEETRALAEQYRRTKAIEFQNFIEIGKGILSQDASLGAQYLAGKELDTLVETSLDDKIQDIEDKWSGGNEADIQAAREWARQQGYDPSSVIGAEGSNKVQLKINGEAVEKTMSEIFYDMAIFELQQQVGLDEKTFEVAIGKVNSKLSSDEAKNAALELADLSKETADFSKISKKAFNELQKLNKEDFSIFAEEAGLSIELLGKKLEDSIDNIEDLYDELWKIDDTAKALWDSFNIDEDQFSYDEQKYLVDNFTSLFDRYGSEVAGDFARVFEIAEDKGDEVIAKMQGTDWATVVDPAKAILDMFSQEQIQLTTEQGKMLEGLAYILAGTTTPLETLQEEMGQFNEFASKIAETNKINKETYDQLDEASQKYFTTLADGTKVLLGISSAIAIEAERKAKKESLESDIKGAEGNLTLATDTVDDDYEINRQELVTELTEGFQDKAYKDKILEAAFRPETLNTIFSDIDKAFSDSGLYATKAVAKANLTSISNPGMVASITPTQYAKQRFLQYKDSFSESEYSQIVSDYLSIQAGSSWSGLTDAQKIAYNLIEHSGSKEVQDYIKLASNYQSAYNNYLDEKTAVQTAIDVFQTRNNSLKENYEIDYTAAEEKNAEAEQKYLELIQQWGKVLTFEEYETELANPESYLNKLTEQQQKDLLRQMQMSAVVDSDAVQGLNYAAIDELEQITNKTFEEILETFVTGELKLAQAQDQHSRTITKLTDEYSKLQGEAKKLNLKAQISELKNGANILKESLQHFYDTDKQVLTANLLSYANTLNSEEISKLGLSAYNLDANSFINPDGSLNYKVVEDFEKWYAENALAIEQNAGLKSDTTKLKELFKSYDKEYIELNEKIADNAKQTLEKEFENFELEFQIKIDEQQFTKDTEKFWREFSDYGATAFATSLSTSLGATQEMFNIYFEKFNDLSNQNLTLSEIITSKQEALNQLQENALAQKQEIAELEEFINSIYETRIEYQQNVIDLTEKQIALNKLIYGETNYNSFSALMSYNKEAYANATKYAKEAAIAARQEVSEFNGDITSDKYKELVAKAIETTQAWGDAIQAETQYVVEAYEISVDRIFSAIEEAATGANREEWARETEWDNSTDERWMDDIEGIYALRDVEREYDKAIEKATGAQKKALQERKISEMAILEAKKQQGKLQQADVERSQKVLEIEQARMALEDARNNKTKMRLTRGADGTYGYQYVADSDAMREAEEKLDGLYEDLYTFDKDRYKSALDEIADLWAEYAEKRKELGADGDLDAEDLAILKGYAEEINKISEVSGTTLYNLGEDIKTAYGEGLTAEEVATLIRTNIGAASTGIANFANDILSKGIDGVIGNYQLELEAETQAIDGYFAKVKDEMNQNKKGSFANHLADVKGLAEGVVTAFGELDVTELNTKLGELKTVFDNLATSIESCITSLWVLKNIDDPIAQVETAAVLGGNGRGIINTAKDNKTVDANATTTEALAEMYNNGIRITDYNGLVSDISMMLTNTGASGDAVGQSQIMDLLSPYINTFKAWSLFDPEKTKSLAAIIKPYVTKEQLEALGLPTAFNTGGYTGSWDSSGRLAVLHEKELVLNKEDTKNILESVSIVRTIASALEGLSNNRIVQMMSGFETSMAAWDVAKEMAIEQKVDITAEFPNATDKDEIMEAFDNLINLASQHAYKTTR